MKQSGNSHYYLSHALCSTMAMVDSTGVIQKSYQYDVYGEVTGGSGSQANEFDFAGQQTDPTGLQYLRARYYDPASGVFLSREPLAVAPGWTGNPFGYGGANPARFVDPTGGRPVDSDGCEDGNEACYRRVQAESEAACAGLYFYTYTYCKERAPFGDWTLIGEYTLNRLLDLAKFWQRGFEAIGEGQIREVEFAVSIGPRMHACAADVACAWAVTLAIHAIAIVAAAVPLGVWGTAALELVADSWTIYSVKAQMEQPTSDRASPVRCRPAEAC